SALFLGSGGARDRERRPGGRPWPTRPRGWLAIERRGDHHRGHGIMAPERTRGGRRVSLGGSGRDSRTESRPRGTMDPDTLELLEFDKVRALVAARAACSLGKEAARRLEPGRDLGEIRDRQALTTEMAESLSAGLMPPFGGLHDIRTRVRRAQVGAV